VAGKKRIFICFPIEDEWARGSLLGQAQSEKSPFDFIDMSPGDPWEEDWEIKCRKLIKQCDGLIAFVSKATENASGQRWEIKCAKEEKIPVLGIYTTKDDRPPSLPPELNGVRVVDWTWGNIKEFLDGL
jgi:nucleoside 2-deoxyribosyltransferase